jgi:hypothetical protein
LEEDLKVPVIDLKMREPEAFTEEELMVSPNNSDKAEGAKE